VPRLPQLRLDQRLQLMVVIDDDLDQRAIPDLARYGIRSISIPRVTSAPGRPGNPGVGVVGRYTPRRNGGNSLVCFACFLG